MENIRPIILAGGLGTRMRPTTYMVPKPLLLVGEHPIIEISIRWLKTFGFKEIGIALGWRGKMIEYHLGDGSQLGVKLHYVTEDKPLGTAGPLSLMKDWIGTDDVFVMNGDILTKLDLHEMVKFHKEKKSVLTVASILHTDRSQYGHLMLKDDRVVGVEEKPNTKNYVSTGMYVLSPEAYSRIPTHSNFQMTDLIMDMSSTSLPMRAYNVDVPWIAVEKMHELDEVSRDPMWHVWVENLCKS